MYRETGQCREIALPTYRQLAADQASRRALRLRIPSGVMADDGPELARGPPGPNMCAELSHLLVRP
eukprot:505355-Pyramimonas_sp.AAC.1